MADDPIYGFKKDTLTEMVRQILAEMPIIPSSLPANGGNADYAAKAGTVNSLRTDIEYSDIFSNTLSNSHACWNKKCSVQGQSTNPNEANYIENAPETTVALWYEVETIGVLSRAYQIAHGCFTHQRKSFIRYMHDGTWSGWHDIYTKGNKPYVTGSATISAGSMVCDTNHGFLPSAIFWWDDNDFVIHHCYGFNDKGFVVKEPFSQDTRLYYMIFR